MSPASRAAYREDLINQAADLCIHGNTPLPMAHDAPLSMVADHFRSSAFASYRKSEEGRQKLALAVIGRLDGMLKSLGWLGKALSRR